MEGLGVRCWVPGPFILSAPWGLRVRGDLSWSYLMISGECSVEIEGHEASTLLGPGDLVVVPQGHAHRLWDRQDSHLDALEGLLQPRHFENGDPLIHGGGGAQTSLACICFLFEDQWRSPLLTSLPPLLNLKGEGGLPSAEVDHIFRHIAQELKARRPCAQTIAGYLVRILLTKAIYLYAEQFTEQHAGWLRGLFDPAIGQAMVLIHRRPEVQWTVASLAEEVAMSRSAFSARFAAIVGKPPLEYLTEWRMHRACVLLVTSDVGLKEIAARVGYNSAASFSKAFTRWAGTAPKVYRDHRRTASMRNPRPADVTP